MAEHTVLASKDWTDDEPDRLWIEVQRDESNGKAFITFTCSSTWLTPEVVENDVIPWLYECVIVAKDNSP
jgi:hypothetical protein